MKFSPMNAAALLLSILPERALTKQASLGGTTATACCTSLSSVLGDKVVYGNSTAYRQSVDSYFAVNVQLKPTCIVQPLSKKDVSLAVSTLTNPAGRACDFAVRSGGHMAWAGASNIENGVTIDLSLMNSTTYNKEKGTATVLPGARWQSVYKALEPFDVTVAGGRAGPVGVGGLLLGGGNTFHTARVGFGCDNVESYEVVLASGEVLTVDARSHPDLFKALKGGSINFGVVTKYELKIIASDQIWGGLVSYNHSTTPKHIPSIVRFIDNIHKDPFASWIGIWQYNSSIDATTLVVPLDYTKPVAYPPAYQDFYQVANISDTTRITSMYDLTEELGQPDGYRDLFLTGTYLNDERAMRKVLEIHDQKIAEAKLHVQSKSWILMTVIQPWAKVFWEESAKRGGNVLGLDRNDHNLWQVMINYAWDHEADDAMFRRLATSALEELNEYTQSIGAYNEFVYLNYADRSQDPLRGYGEENVQYLRKVAQKYDPAGVFQKHVPGGFKISQVHP